MKATLKKRLILSMGILAAAIMLPTSVMLMVGMLPTLVMLLFDHTPDKSRVMTVGAMNLAGCMPFIIELWHRGHTIDLAFDYVTEPRTVVIMYFAAGIGYMIEWVVTGLVASMMTQKARSRIDELNKLKKNLETRWGEEVTGKYALDDEGFMIDANKNG